MEYDESESFRTVLLELLNSFMDLKTKIMDKLKIIDKYISKTNESNFMENISFSKINILDINNNIAIDKKI